MLPIPNQNLTPADIPPTPATHSAVVAFAHTFNGYGALGFDACAELANHPERCQSLTDFRAALFFEQRRFNHQGRDPTPAEAQHINHLIDQIRAKVLARQLD